MQIDSEDSENKGTYSTAFNMAKQCDRCYNYIYILTSSFLGHLVPHQGKPQNRMVAFRLAAF